MTVTNRCGGFPGVTTIAFASGAVAEKEWPCSMCPVLALEAKVGRLMALMF